MDCVLFPCETLLVYWNASSVIQVITIIINYFKQNFTSSNEEPSLMGDRLHCHSLWVQLCTLQDKQWSRGENVIQGFFVVAVNWTSFMVNMVAISQWQMLKFMICPFCPLLLVKSPTIQPIFLKMNKDIATGMAYLAAKGFVHRVGVQLACRYTA